MIESAFKRNTKDYISELLPGCFMFEMKAGAQGVPDTLVLYQDKWALLEFKRDANASHRPNQDYYICKFSAMGFAEFIYPENCEEVLERLVDYFGDSA